MREIRCRSLITRDALDQRLILADLLLWRICTHDDAHNHRDAFTSSQLNQNYDGASAYGAVWHWAGSANSHGAPLNSPNPDTASQKGYNIAAQGGKGTPQRRSWLDELTEGDKRELYGQGRPRERSAPGPANTV